MPSSVASVFDAMTSLSDDNVSLLQQYLGMHMAFCQDSCPFKASLCMIGWMHGLAQPGQKLLQISWDSPCVFNNFPRVAMFEKFLPRPTLHLRTGKTGPSSQGQVMAMSKGAMKSP